MRGNAGHDRAGLVVVDGLDALRSVRRPDEADPVLVVDPDRVLPRSVATEHLEACTRRRARRREVGQDFGGVEHVELAASGAVQFLWHTATCSLGILAIEEVFGLGVGEGLNHWRLRAERGPC